ncbi:MAG: CRISPR-associated protein Csx15 [Anaerolineae bacterium]|nr:CRISPR-associated protein Csx15 [Caldilineales bacterium]MCX7854176.1 CRISPR-associated protein Csx15 [Caldilineales bacterium]MDW8270159.1 CRISPR-associated protein Csx15 [Anaerolineae bacterium]
MIVLNFAHPLTQPQLEQIEALTGQPIERIVEINSQMDPQEPLAPQVSALADRCGLSPTEWQTSPILVNPPSLNFSAVVLIAELHGRMGYFPPCVRLRPVKDALPPRFEVAEILNLQGVREAARVARSHT